MRRKDAVVWIIKDAEGAVVWMAHFVGSRMECHELSSSLIPLAQAMGCDVSWTHSSSGLASALEQMAQAERRNAPATGNDE